MKEYTSCFLGIPLPQEYQSEFEALLEDARGINKHLETIDPQTPHVTVYYLGCQPEPALPKIAGIAQNYSGMLQGGMLEIGHLGFFRPGNPRIVFLDVKYPSVFSEFNQVIAQNLARFSQGEENLPFHPHLTVARMRTEEAQLSFAQKKPQLEVRMSQVCWKFPLTEVVLYGAERAKNSQPFEPLIRVPI